MQSVTDVYAERQRDTKGLDADGRGSGEESWICRAGGTKYASQPSSLRPGDLLDFVLRVSLWHRYSPQRRRVTVSGGVCPVRTEFCFATGRVWLIIDRGGGGDAPSAKVGAAARGSFAR